MIDHIFWYQLHRLYRTGFTNSSMDVKEFMNDINKVTFILPHIFVLAVDQRLIFALVVYYLCVG